MEENFYKVWSAEEYDKQPRGEGWLIMGDSHSEEEQPWAIDACDAALEWGKAQEEDGTLPDDIRVVVVGDKGEERRYVVRRRVSVNIYAERCEDAP